jgi:formate dehydrogenase major subunit
MSTVVAGPAEGCEFSLDGATICAWPGETILQTAQRLGTAIHHLCHQDRLRPDGNCRACMVEIEGERVLAPACCRQPTSGMRVQTRSERAQRAQRLVLELLRADLAATPYTYRSELDQWCDALAVGASRFPRRE